MGGWPCQDISLAGTLGGHARWRSGLFFDMLRTAIAADAYTLIGENVPNLLTINNGNDFQVVLETLSEAGYPYICWRILNARQFGLASAAAKTVYCCFAPQRTSRSVALGYTTYYVKSEITRRFCVLLDRREEVYLLFSRVHTGI